MLLSQQFMFFFALTFISFISIQFVYAQTAENEIIKKALETVEKASTEGLSEINESVSNTSKSIAKLKENAVESPDTESTIKKPSEEIAMKIQLEEHNNEMLADDDYYEVSDFAFVASNSSKLCPSGMCEYELEDGVMEPAFTAGERTLTGKFKVDTGESKKIMNMLANWETVEERETPDSETILVIEGNFGVGRNQFSPENKYQINGTLTPDGDVYILEAKGMK